MLGRGLCWDIAPVILLNILGEYCSQETFVAANHEMLLPFSDSDVLRKSVSWDSICC